MKLVFPISIAVTLLAQSDRVHANHLRQPSIPDDIDDCIPSPDLKEAIAAGATDPDSICQNGAGGWFGFTHAYQCDDERGPGYACCDETDATLNPGHILGTCTKMTTLTATEVKVQDSEEADEDGEEDVMDCSPSWDLKDAVEAGVTDADSICKNEEKGSWFGYEYAYKCEKSPGYACCDEDQASLSTNILGTCTRMTSDENIESKVTLTASEDKSEGANMISDTNSEEADEDEEEDFMDCSPSWDLKDAVEAGVTDADSICKNEKKGSWFGYEYAYKCEKSPGYACCDEDQSSLSTNILGTCTRMTSDENIESKVTLTTLEDKVQGANTIGDTSSEEADEDGEEGVLDCMSSDDLEQAVTAGATDPDVICQNAKRGKWFGYEYAYKCDSSYACCDEDQATLSTNVLGTCTRMKSNEDINSQS